jgi:PAS domain S-box-containing protein
MNHMRKTKAQLIEELTEARGRIATMEKTAGPDRRLMATLVDQMHEPTLILDFEGHLLHGNTLAADVLGLAGAAQIAGMELAAIMHPDSVAQAAADLAAVQQSEADFFGNYKLLIDGRTIHINSHGTRIELADGQVDLVSFRDVTEQRAMEQRERTNDMILRSVLDHASTVVFVKDVDGRYMLINKRYEDLFGVTNKEINGKTDFDIFPDEVAERFQEKDRKALAIGGPIEEEEVVPHPDGPHTYLSVKFPIFDSDGVAIATCGVATDISERKRAEDAVKAARDQLDARVIERTRELEEEVDERRQAQEQLGLFSKLAEASGSGLGMADLDGTTTYLNPEICRMLGFESSEEGIGRPIREFHPEEVWQQIESEAMPAVTAQGEWSGETALISRTGDVTPVIQSLFVLRNEAGEPFKLASVLTDISARRNAWEALKESESKFRAVADITSAIIMMAGEDGRIFYAEKATGYTLEEISKLDPMTELFDMPGQEQDWLKEFERAAQTGETISGMELRIRTKDGQNRWIEASGKYIRLGGQLVDVSTGFDITDRKRTEEALRESEKKFRALAEFSNAQITVIQEDCYVYANQAFLDYHGIDDEELELITPEELGLGMMSEESIQHTVGQWQAAMERGDSHFRVEFPDLDGNWFQTEVSILELGGKESYLGMTFDITEVKRVQAALADSEQLYRTIFDTAGTGMISFGADTVISLANEEWATLSGYSLEETVGKLSWPQFFSEKSLARMQKYHEMRTLDPDSVPKAYEAEFIDREGKIHEGIINIQVVPGTQQRVASFQDLTALKRAQSEMYRADKMAALGQIIAGVAHEINNPNNFIYFNLPILRKYIQAIRPMLDARLQEDPDLTILNMPYKVFLDDVFKLLENMEHGSKRITSIVSDLKNYVRSDESQDLQPEQIGCVVDRVMTLVGKQVRKMVGRFDVSVAEDLPPVEMNQGKIEQVLINLVINAGQAADKDDAWVELQVRHSSNDPGWVEILIEDNGAGIPKKNLEQIFEPFFTSKGREQGTGLGLSISHRIIEEHGGRIHVKSTPGAGTVFTISLPAAHA